MLYTRFVIILPLSFVYVFFCSILLKRYRAVSVDGYLWVRAIRGNNTDDDDDDGYYHLIFFSGCFFFFFWSVVNRDVGITPGIQKNIPDIPVNITNTRVRNAPGSDVQTCIRFIVKSARKRYKIIIKQMYE